MRDEIGPHTRITLTTAVALIGSAITIAGLFASIKADVAQVRKHMEADWTLREMIMWTARFSDMNRSNVNIYVPEPENIWQRLNNGTTR